MFTRIRAAVQDTSKNYYIHQDEVQFAISDEEYLNPLTTIGLFDFLDDMNSLEL